MGSPSVDWERRTGTLGTWLRKPYWGRDGTFRNFQASREGPVDAVRYTALREGWVANRPEDPAVRLE